MIKRWQTPHLGSAKDQQVLNADPAKPVLPQQFPTFMKREFDNEDGDPFGTNAGFAQQAEDC